MKIVAGVILILSSLAFACGFPIIAMIRMEGPGLVTDLDRAGAINADVIKRDFPQYAKNLRGSLGIAMHHRHQQVLLFFVTLGFLSSSVGAFALLKRDKKNEN
jgi:hypothetical protein